MRTLLCAGCLGLAALFGLNLASGSRADEATAPGEAPEQQLKPRWQIGQRWVVETVSVPIQTSDTSGTRPGKPVRWEFKVVRKEKVGDHSCFRVEVTSKTVPDAPKTVLWVDDGSLALRQVEAGMLVQGEERRVRERYDFEDGQPSPVIAPLSNLPLDLPVFSTVRPRSGKYGYKARAVDAKEKPGDEISFSFQVEQKLAPASLAVARGALNEDEKTGGKKPTYEVRMKSPEREVMQLWRPGSPWPVYADNGNTKARLIQVLPATGSR